MFKILKWRNGQDVELKTIMDDSKLKYITKILDERGLSWKTEDYTT
jgi:hypothetical protein